jgi:hypothetical protein
VPRRSSWAGFPDGGDAHPCPRLLSPDVGPSVADLIAAIENAGGTSLIAGPADVTIGGRPAVHLTLAVRKDIGCRPGFFYRWRDIKVGALWTATRVGDTMDVWIVDVDGRRLFIEAETSRHADTALTREVREIVRSIRFP